MADKATKYYRSPINGLSVVVGDPSGNDVAPQTVRFDTFKEMFQGEWIKVGYLATDNAVAQRKLKDDPNAEEIDADEYAKYTDPEVNPKVIKVVN